MILEPILTIAYNSLKLIESPMPNIISKRQNRRKETYADE